MVFRIVQRFQAIVERGLRKASSVISRWTKPASHVPVLGTITDLVRSKPQLLAENFLLRQQLSVLNRSVKRPRLTCADRCLFVLLASTGFQKSVQSSGRILG